MRTDRRARISVSVTVVLLISSALARTQTTFRSTADLIAIDVQVIGNKTGVPVLGLTADFFDVSLNGRRRKVVSADLVRYSAGAESSAPGIAPPEAGRLTPGEAGRTDSPRLFVIAVDSWSFDPGTARGMAAAAKSFVEQLQPADYVGLVAYPFGPEVPPTTDRALIVEALDKRLVGAREQPPSNRFGLSVSDVTSLVRVGDVSRAGVRWPACGTDENCGMLVKQEAEALARFWEMQATQSLGRLRDLIGGLSRLNRRTILVLLSGGMPVGDGNGGRPDIGNLGVLVGQDAARANVSVYTLFVDWQFLDSFRASSSRASVRPLADSALNSRWLDQFSGTSGGKLFTVSVGNGEFAFTRILAETSSFYLLGVQPEDSDRDGSPRRLSVKVRQSGVTVRARQWAVVARRNSVPGQ